MFLIIYSKMVTRNIILEVYPQIKSVFLKTWNTGEQPYLVWTGLLVSFYLNDQAALLFLHGKYS